MDAIDPELAPRYAASAEARKRAGRGLYQYESRYWSRGPDHRDRSPVWMAVFHARGEAARALYREHHIKLRKPQVRTDLGYVWSYTPYGSREPHGWKAHSIQRMTAKRIFIAADDAGRQLALDRIVLERDGKWRPHWSKPAYYTPAGKLEEELDSVSAWAARVSRSAEDVALLGLPPSFTKRDVIRAFRVRAQVHHPDKGGDPAAFRRLVEARDNALRCAA